MFAVQVLPIEAPQLQEVGRFLHENLNPRIAADDWIASVTHPWCEARPNYGMQLREGERLVGVFLAIYSDQVVAGRTERFCNPHSWCVLESHRNHGIGLVLALIRQPDYHFTMLTPNPKVAEIFRHLKFRDLDRRVVTFPNLPSLRRPGAGTFVESEPDRIAIRLSGPVIRDFALHRDIRWLRFVAFGQGADACLVAFKTARWKRLPCARIIHVSDRAAFARHAALLRNHLMLRCGLPVSRAELRFLNAAPQPHLLEMRTQAKLFLSRTLADSQIPDFYSELVSLDV